MDQSIKNKKVLNETPNYSGSPIPKVDYSAGNQAGSALKATGRARKKLYQYRNTTEETRNYEGDVYSPFQPRSRIPRSPPGRSQSHEALCKEVDTPKENIIDERKTQSGRRNSLPEDCTQQRNIERGKGLDSEEKKYSRITEITTSLQKIIGEHTGSDTEIKELTEINNLFLKLLEEKKGKADKKQKTETKVTQVSISTQTVSTEEIKEELEICELRHGFNVELNPSEMENILTKE